MSENRIWPMNGKFVYALVSCKGQYCPKCVTVKYCYKCLPKEYCPKCVPLITEKE
jgi:hypothetical protein